MKIKRSIERTFEEWKEGSEGYRMFCESYIDELIARCPKSKHEEFYNHWDKLLKDYEYEQLNRLVIHDVE